MFRKQKALGEKLRIYCERRSHLPADSWPKLSALLPKGHHPRALRAHPDKFAHRIEDLESIAFQARINGWEDERSARIFDASPTPRQTVFATFVETLQASDTWGVYNENRPHTPKTAIDYFWQDYGHNKLTIAALK